MKTDTIKLCGHLGLSLLGHQDDSKYPEVGYYSQGGVGNFVQLIHFCIRAGDKVIKDHLNSATYISKNSQNELIKCCGKVITVKNSNFFFPS